jgi:hypothetical protein
VAKDQIHDWSNVAGPVALAYELDQSPISVVIGPTGAGKTIASARKILRVALNQHPSPRDGIRKARIAVLAPSYRVLWDTAIASYQKVYPTHGAGKWGEWKGSRGDPADHIMEIDHPSGQLYIEVQFRAFSDQSAEEFMRGREVTAWWFPEMDTMPSEDVLSLAFNRRGRYPEPQDRPENPPFAAYAGIFGDANAPVIGGWFHRRFYVERKASDRLYLQPSYDQPGAENLHNLRRINPNYYQDLANGMADYDIERLLRCKPGWSRFGKPVHEAFDVRDHVARGPVEPVSGVVLEIGCDAGGTLKPAAVFAQRVMGQRRILDEISPAGRQIDLVEFAQEVRRLKDTRFSHIREARIVVDPSARAGSVTNRQLTFAQILQQQSGIRVDLAPTNNPATRRTALDRKLKMRGGWIVDPRCVGLIEALAGGYCFGQVRRQTGNSWGEAPVKNDHSHIAEAEQYGCLGMEGESVGDGGLIDRPRWGDDMGGAVLLP